MSEAEHKYKFGSDKKFADAWEEFQKRRKDKPGKPLPKKRRRRRKGAEVTNDNS